MKVLRTLGRNPTRTAVAGFAIACSCAVGVARQRADAFAEVVTEGGSRIWSFPDDGGDRFVLLILVGSGSRSEERERAGIAHFLEHVLFASTALGSKRELDSAADEHGATFNGFTDQECTAFYIASSSADWRFAVDWLTQHVTRPAFAPADIEAERRIVCEELDLRNPHAGAATFESLLYPGHALGRGIGGDKGSVGEISAAALQRFYAEHYRAANIAVGFAGRVPREECTEAIRAAIASLPHGEVDSPTPPVEPRAGTLIYGDGDDADRSGTVTLGYHLPAAGARELAQQLAIGLYLDGRFNDEVREARQLSYAPSVGLHHYSDTHRLQFVAHVSDEGNLPAIVGVCDALIAELARPDAARLARARETLRSVLHTDSAGDLARAMKLAWLLRRRGESPDALLAALEHVDANSVADYAAANLTPKQRFVVSNSMLLGRGLSPWLIAAIVVVVFAAIDGFRGFAVTRSLRERWASFVRRRSVRRKPKRRKQPAGPKLEPIDAAELERNFQRYFEDQDRKRDG